MLSKNLLFEYFSWVCRFIHVVSWLTLKKKKFILCLWLFSNKLFLVFLEIFSVGTQCITFDLE